jgi:hypothetical protein
MAEHLPPCLQLTPSTLDILGIFPAPKAAAGAGSITRRMQRPSRMDPRDENMKAMVLVKRILKFDK